VVPSLQGFQLKFSFRYNSKTGRKSEHAPDVHSPPNTMFVAMSSQCVSCARGWRSCCESFCGTCDDKNSNKCKCLALVTFHQLTLEPQKEMCISDTGWVRRFHYFSTLDFIRSRFLRESVSTSSSPHRASPPSDRDVIIFCSLLMVCCVFWCFAIHKQDRPGKFSGSRGYFPLCPMDKVTPALRRHAIGLPLALDGDGWAAAAALPPGKGPWVSMQGCCITAEVIQRGW